MRLFDKFETISISAASLALVEFITTFFTTKMWNYRENKLVICLFTSKIFCKLASLHASFELSNVYTWKLTKCSSHFFYHRKISFSVMRRIRFRPDLS